MASQLDGYDWQLAAKVGDTRSGNQIILTCMAGVVALAWAVVDIQLAVEAYQLILTNASTPHFFAIASIVYLAVAVVLRLPLVSSVSTFIPSELERQRYVFAMFAPTSSSTPAPPGAAATTASPGAAAAARLPLQPPARRRMSQASLAIQRQESDVSASSVTSVTSVTSMSSLSDSSMSILLPSTMSLTMMSLLGAMLACLLEHSAIVMLSHVTDVAGAPPIALARALYIPSALVSGTLLIFLLLVTCLKIINDSDKDSDDDATDLDASSDDSTISDGADRDCCYHFSTIMVLLLFLGPAVLSLGVGFVQQSQDTALWIFGLTLMYLLLALYWIKRISSESTIGVPCSALDGLRYFILFPIGLAAAVLDGLTAIAVPEHLQYPTVLLVVASLASSLVLAVFAIALVKNKLSRFVGVVLLRATILLTILGGLLWLPIDLGAPLDDPINKSLSTQAAGTLPAYPSLYAIRTITAALLMVYSMFSPWYIKAHRRSSKTDRASDTQLSNARRIRAVIMLVVVLGVALTVLYLSGDVVSAKLVYAGLAAVLVLLTILVLIVGAASIKTSILHPPVLGSTDSASTLAGLDDASTTGVAGGIAVLVLLSLGDLITDILYVTVTDITPSLYPFLLAFLPMPLLGTCLMLARLGLPAVPSWLMTWQHCRDIYQAFKHRAVAARIEPIPWQPLFRHLDNIFKFFVWFFARLLWLFFGVILTLLMRLLAKAAMLLFAFIILPPLLPLVLAASYFAVLLRILALITYAMLVTPLKLMVVPSMDLWFRAMWTATDEYELAAKSDQDEVRERQQYNYWLLFASETILESIPQIALQVANNQIQSLWGPIAAASAAFSGLMILSHVYRFVYLRMYLGIYLREMPVFGSPTQAEIERLFARRSALHAGHAAPTEPPPPYQEQAV